MSTPPEARPTPPARRRLTAALLTLGRPLLLISFALYQLEVRRNLYPRDALVSHIDGVDPLRMLFVGDVAASGHGVLSHGLTVVTRAAEHIAVDSGRGAEWSIVAEPDLTMKKLAHRTSYGAQGAEVAFLLLGIPDVLLSTSPERWAAQLETVVRRIQAESGLRAPRVVVSGIPPLSDFRPINPTARRIINQRVDRLNAASADVADHLPGLSYVPFPTWRIGDMFIKEMFSWKTMHDAWGETLAASLRPGT
ncbi:GDSL-type esterase/lipase family protein [Frondihabitans australicus]|nr:GDSL-type esterase/lipase family protein [Frondihabitans australicus]